MAQRDDKNMANAYDHQSRRLRFLGVLIFLLFVIDLFFALYLSNLANSLIAKSGSGDRISACCGPLFLTAGGVVANLWDILSHEHNAILALFTIVLAVVTTALALYTRQLWTATVELGRKSDATAKQQAEDTQNLLSISKQSADAASKSADIASAALVITQRASIHVKDYVAAPVSIDDQGVKAWKVGMRFENTGNTRADFVQAGVALTEVPLDGNHELGPFKVLDLDKNGALVVGPQGVVNASGVEGKDILTLDAVKRMMLGEIDVFLCGRADYRDIFPASPPRHTTVCVRISIVDSTLKKSHPFGFNAHTKYNEAT